MFQTSQHPPPLAPRLTSTAALHFSHLVEGIGQQVGESPVQVHRCQAALVTFPGCYQSGQAAIHALPNAANVQLTYETEERVSRKILSRKPSTCHKRVNVGVSVLKTTYTLTILCNPIQVVCHKDCFNHVFMLLLA